MEACLVMLLLLVALCPHLPPPPPPAAPLTPPPVPPGHSWPGGAGGDRCTHYLLLSPLTYLPSAVLLPYFRALNHHPHHPPHLYISCKPTLSVSLHLLLLSSSLPLCQASSRLTPSSFSSSILLLSLSLPFLLSSYSA